MKLRIVGSLINKKNFYDFDFIQRNLIRFREARDTSIKNTTPTIGRVSSEKKISAEKR